MVRTVADADVRSLWKVMIEGYSQAIDHDLHDLNE